jgi:hypothetical protein
MLLENLFNGLVSAYREKKPGRYGLRVNVMRVRKKIWPFRQKFLHIDYFMGNYSTAEKEQEYLENIGCCGTAIHENTPISFDTKRAQEPWKGMSATQRDVTRDVKSILSIPIYRPKDESKRSPIAVLNLDSKNLIKKTGFDKAGLQRLAARYAELIGGILG